MLLYLDGFNTFITELEWIINDLETLVSFITP